MTTLEHADGRMCGGNLGLHQGLVTFKRLWAIVYIVTLGMLYVYNLCSHPKNGVSWSFRNHDIMSFSVNMPREPLCTRSQCLIQFMQNIDSCQEGRKL